MSTVDASIVPTVAAAVVYLNGLFSAEAEPSGDGGAIVVVRGLDIGETWTPTSMNLTFEIPFNYPFAAIYPFYCEAGLARADGQALPSALQRVDWRGGSMTQVSLRASRWNPQIDTAAGAVLQVQEWFRHQ